ncbi:hypothetical protein Tco_1179615 [Tanacetum coccineum]
MDLFFLYCIYEEEVTCNIPYWLAWYFKKDKDVICRGMFVTRTTKEHVFKKRSLIAMDVVMDMDIIMEMIRFVKQGGWTTKTHTWGDLILGWASRMSGPTGCMTTPFASSNICPPVIT